MKRSNQKLLYGARSRTKSALAVMQHLATNEGHLLSAHDLSETAGLSRSGIETLLRQLREAGLIMGKRGIGGGYCLPDHARPTVGEIIKAVQGGVLHDHCADDEHSPETSKLWRAMETNLLEVLELVSLAEVWGNALTLQKLHALAAGDAAHQQATAG